MPQMMLITAAEMRSSGASWEAVAQTVGESPKTCQEWPRLFRNEWDPLYREAEHRRCDEAGSEALAVLRVLLRESDDKTKMRSADILLRVRHQRLMAFPPLAPLSDVDAEALKMVRDDQAWEAIFKKRLDLEHAANGLPPATAAEVNEAILLEYDDCRAAKARRENPKPPEIPNPAPDPEPDNYGFSNVAGRMALGVLMFITTLVMTAISQQRSSAYASAPQKGTSYATHACASDSLPASEPEVAADPYNGQRTTEPGQRTTMPHYTPREIEPRWQKYWDEHRVFSCPDPADSSVAGKPKIYVLDMFPYPSGAGLHVGHPEGYTATDILCRYKRMRGFHVLHPMGWDAFGLPAEQYAIDTGTHPRLTTQRNIDTFRRQIKSLGFSYDWEREVDTTDPAYVKWTQWIFLQIYDTWYDPVAKKGRPIADLPIPLEIEAKGDEAVRRFQDSKRLALRAEVPVNWCPALGTVLANEEVIDGKSERGSHPVVRMPLRQWLLRITEYAERLIDDLEPLDWSESIKAMQRNWIGKSEGAEVDFNLSAETLIREGVKQIGDETKIRVFTTRPDTLFGATYMVLSPEHPLVPRITAPERLAEVKAYREQAARKSDFERTEVSKSKTGAFTGAYAMNPANNEKVPIWIADYVLATYGTGAIMAVPAHDERDFEFAKQFGLPIKAVVKPTAEWLKKTKSTIDDLTEPYTEAGEAIHSGPYDGTPTEKFKNEITEWLRQKGLGFKRVNYKLRDWLFSRQRYWGEPFPLLHELDAEGKANGLIRPLTEKDLPLRLPELEDFKPTGSPEGPLAKATDWTEVTIDGKKYRRETNTMPQWAGSCWYYLRYLDPKNDKSFCDPAKAKHWLPVDLYVGGAEHAVLHLLYSRFWHKVLFDRGHMPCPEPFQRLVNQGMILGEPNAWVRCEIDETVPDKLGAWISHDECMRRSKEPGFSTTIEQIEDERRVEERGGKEYIKGTQIDIFRRAEKMSKSRGNVVNPDDVVRDYGADSLRLYEMFMGPLEAVKPWNMKGVEGVSRFLSRVWRLIVDEAAEELVLNAKVQEVEPDKETLRFLHRTIQKVTEDTDGLRFNTAIAAMMEFSNHLTSKVEVRPKKALESFVLILAPYAPHVAEELWHILGHSKTLAYEPWPSYDPALTKSDEIEIPVQINGKLRTKLTVAAGIADADLEKAALADEKIKEQLAGKTIKKVIVVPRKMVNIVVG